MYKASKSLAEILQTVKDTDGTVLDKAKVLLQNDRKDVRWYVYHMYNTDMSTITVPESFKKSNRPYGLSYSSINNSIVRLDTAIRSKNSVVARRNFLNVLETVSNEEADVLFALLQGKKYEGISKAVFKAAYPTFFRKSDETPVD